MTRPITSGWLCPPWKRTSLSNCAKAGSPCLRQNSSSALKTKSVEATTAGQAPTAVPQRARAVKTWKRPRPSMRRSSITSKLSSSPCASATLGRYQPRDGAGRRRRALPSSRPLRRSMRFRAGSWAGWRAAARRTKHREWPALRQNPAHSRAPVPCAGGRHAAPAPGRSASVVVLASADGSTSPPRRASRSLLAVTNFAPSAARRGTVVRPRVESAHFGLPPPSGGASTPLLFIPLLYHLAPHPLTTMSCHPPDYHVMSPGQ
jgi:hypothetical protein